MRPARPARGVRHAAPLFLAALVLGGCGSGGTTVIEAGADGASATPVPADDAEAMGAKAALLDRTSLPDPIDDPQTPPPGLHPDPCGVDNNWDIIVTEGPDPEAVAPASRVEAAAKKL